jgi:hypothetical protein
MYSYFQGATLSTSRGCFLETDPVPCFSSTPDCSECEENNCNGIIFPIPRPRCKHNLFLNGFKLKKKTTYTHTFNLNERGLVFLNRLFK